MRVQLETRDRGFVHAAEIPPFVPPPEVISWGTRIFVHSRVHAPVDSDLSEPEIYIEGLLWPLVEVPADVRRI
jgi:hypothetical protein